MSLLIVRGGMNNTLQQSRYFSRYSVGVWAAEFFSRKEIILVCPLPLMSKGESDWLLLPSSPKGEIVGIMIHMLYLMATHSSQMINYSAAKLFSGSQTFTQRKVHALSCRKSSFHEEKRSRTFMQRKVHALSCREKHTHMGNLMVGS